VTARSQQEKIGRIIENRIATAPKLIHQNKNPFWNLHCDYENYRSSVGVLSASIERRIEK
jgi:hypothetical protein